MNNNALKLLIDSREEYQKHHRFLLEQNKHNNKLKKELVEEMHLRDFILIEEIKKQIGY